MYKFLYSFIRILTDALFPLLCIHCGLVIAHSSGLCRECMPLLNKDLLKEIKKEERCSFCSRPMTQMGRLCASCLSLQYYKRGEYHGNYTLSHFSEAIKVTIYQAKFAHNYAYIQFWARELDKILLDIDPSYRLILAPSSQKREHIMQVIAQELHRYYGWKIITDGLCKHKKITQKNLSFQERLTAQQANIYLHKRYKSQVINQKWLILDDIYTTGSTLYYSAVILRKAGAKEVRSITLTITEYT